MCGFRSKLYPIDSPLIDEHFCCKSIIGRISEYRVIKLIAELRRVMLTLFCEERSRIPDRRFA